MADQGFNAGSIFVALKASVDDFKSGLRVAVSELKSFTSSVGSTLSKVAAVGKQLGTAMLAPVRAIGSLTSSLFTLKAAIIGFLASRVFDALVTGPARASVELERMAARAGVAAEKLKLLQFVVTSAGGRGDDVSIGLEKLNRVILDTKNGSQDFVPILKELGILGLDINEVIDKILKNPNLGAGGLKKLGISELAVLTKLSREEIDKLLESFVRLGNDGSTSFSKIAGRLQLVKTQLATAFGNIAENISQLILPPILTMLEAIERFIEAHFPEILAFFDVVRDNIKLIFDNVKRLIEVPAAGLQALAKFGNLLGGFVGKLLEKILVFVTSQGIEAAAAVFVGIVDLVGPFFVGFAAAFFIELGGFLRKLFIINQDFSKFILDLWIGIAAQLFSKITVQFGGAIRGIAASISGVARLLGLEKIATGLDLAANALVTSGQALAVGFNAVDFAMDEAEKRLGPQLRKVNEDVKQLRDGLTDIIKEVAPEVAKAQVEALQKAVAIAAEGVKGGVEEFIKDAVPFITQVGEILGIKFSDSVVENFKNRVLEHSTELQRQVQLTKNPPSSTQEGGLGALGIPFLAITKMFEAIGGPQGLKNLKDASDRFKEAVKQFTDGVLIFKTGSASEIRQTIFGKSNRDTFNEQQPQLASDLRQAGFSEEDIGKKLATIARSAEVKDFNDTFASGFSHAVGDGLRDAILSGKGALETLTDIGNKLFANLVDNFINNLQNGITAGLNTLFNAIGGGLEGLGSAIGGLLSAVAGIAGAIFARRKGSSNKSFGNVADIVTSSQAVRGIVAGPESVAIAAVGEDLARALEPTNDILRSQLVALFDIRNSLTGGKGGGGAPFAGAVPTA